MNDYDQREHSLYREGRLRQLGINPYSPPPKKETTTSLKYRHDDPHYAQNAEAGLYEPSKIPPFGVANLPTRFKDPPRGLIDLSDTDVEEALGGADMLRSRAVKKGYREKYGCTDGAKKQRIGALGELALARALDVPWDPQPGTHGRTSDVAGWQVRTRKGPYDLCLQPELKELRWPFMLVQTIHYPTVFNIAGWIWGVDGHQSPWYGPKDDEHYLYWVPPDWLHDQHLIHPGDIHNLENATYVKRPKATDTWSVAPGDDAAGSQG